MSDFLSRLAGRSMGVEAVVEPVIPAMTAPPARYVGLVEQEEFTESAQTSSTRERTDAAPYVRESPAEQSLSVRLPGAPEREGILTPREEPASSGRARLENSAKTTVETGARLPDDALAARTLPAWDRARAPVAGADAWPPAVRQTIERKETPAAAAPIIRVTIGRVEVRADMSAPKARTASRSQAKSAAVSLDDYLKQRAEGRR